MSPRTTWGIRLVIGAAYLTALALPSWIPIYIEWTLIGVLCAAILVGWLEGGRPTGLGWRLSLGLPLHLLLLMTGGLGSPLLVLFIPWLLLLTPAMSARALTQVAIATLVWVILIEAFGGRFQSLGAVEASLTLLAGALPAWILQSARAEALRPPSEVERVIGAAELIPERDGPRPSPSNELEVALDEGRQRLGAQRAILWEIEEEEDRAVPRLTTGDPVNEPVPLRGDPIRLAWENLHTIRTETAPHWASPEGYTALTPLDQEGEYPLLLTFEFSQETAPPELEAIDEVAAQIRLRLETQREIALADAARERVDTIVELLRTLPERSEPEAFAAELARVAREFLEASGAAVATWEGDLGHLLCIDSDDGGVPPGTAFGILESQLARAAERMTTLIEHHRIGERGELPLISASERWHAQPQTTIVIPLHGRCCGVTGLLAVWYDRPMRVDPDDIEILQLVAPYAAMQLFQLKVHGPVREFAERDLLTGLYDARVLADRIRAEEAHYRRYRRPTALVVLELDGLDQIDAEYNRGAGERLLKTLGSLLRATVRGSDLVARIDDESFAILLPDTPLSAALEIAQRLRRQIELMRIEWEGRELVANTTIAVAAAPESAKSPKELLPTARMALESTREKGENQVIAAPHLVTG